MTVREAEEYLEQYTPEEYPFLPHEEGRAECFLVPPEILYLPERDLYFAPAYKGVLSRAAGAYFPGDESLVAFFPGGDGSRVIPLRRESLVYALAEYLHPGLVTPESYAEAAAMECTLSDCCVLGLW